MQKTIEKISDLSIRDMRVRHACTMILDEFNRNPEYRDFLSKFRSHGIEALPHEKKVYLTPIQDLQGLLVSNGLSGEIEHVGVLENEYAWGFNAFNNLEQLDRIGIFGNPDLNSPTYVRPVELKTKPSNRFQSRVILKIDPTKLNTRLILPDPEMYMPNVFWYLYQVINQASLGEILKLFKMQGELPLSAFMVMGGIPKEAIISISQMQES